MDALLTIASIRFVGHGLMKMKQGSAVCCSYINNKKSLPSQASVFTAARLNASVIRIVGPGSSFIPSGLGNVLTLDEFFLYPLPQHDETYQTETLTYFLEENVNNHEIMDARGNELSRHGIQVRFQTDIADTDNMNKALSKGFSKDLNVVEMSDANKLFLESGKGKGGAEVRVIAGQFEHISSSISYEESILLDILMRPGSEATIPLNPSHGTIIYIMEGVGIFNKSGLLRSFYENEGHGIWFPPLLDGDLSGSPLCVSSHLWSSLRFLVLTSPL